MFELVDHQINKKSILKNHDFRKKKKKTIEGRGKRILVE